MVNVVAVSIYQPCDFISRCALSDKLYELSFLDVGSIINSEVPENAAQGRDGKTRDSIVGAHDMRTQQPTGKTPEFE